MHYITAPLRQTAGGQTLDSFIQMGLDHPDCPVGLIAADEYTYETFDEIVKEVSSQTLIKPIRFCDMRKWFI